MKLNTKFQAFLYAGAMSVSAVGLVMSCVSPDAAWGAAPRSAAAARPDARAELGTSMQELRSLVQRVQEDVNKNLAAKAQPTISEIELQNRESLFFSDFLTDRESGDSIEPRLYHLKNEVFPEIVKQFPECEKTGSIRIANELIGRIGCVGCAVTGALAAELVELNIGLDPGSETAREIERVVRDIEAQIKNKDRELRWKALAHDINVARVLTQTVNKLRLERLEVTTGGREYISGKSIKALMDFRTSDAEYIREVEALDRRLRLEINRYITEIGGCTADSHKAKTSYAVADIEATLQKYLKPETLGRLMKIIRDAQAETGFRPREKEDGSRDKQDEDHTSKLIGPEGGIAEELLLRVQKDYPPQGVKNGGLFRNLMARLKTITRGELAASVNQVFGKKVGGMILDALNGSSRADALEKLEYLLSQG